jgi:glycosyltransferase involved in cell wall biosynthesis
MRTSMINYVYPFTVFTPTYNRAHTLHRVYESLLAQTFTDFEWLIVDDGSSDTTRELVASWQAPFPIRYLYKENGGKHTAFNLGVQEARGEFFLTFDSDDSCVPQALETFYEVWRGIEDKASFAGVTALCMTEEGEIVGDKFIADTCDATYLEDKYIHKIKGEKWGFQRTDVLKEFPFPEPEGLKLVSEGYVWARISRKYQTRYVNECLRVYYAETESYIHAAPAKYATELAYSGKEALNYELGYFWKAPFTFVRQAVHYVRFSLHAHAGLFRGLEPALGRVLVSVCLPAGALVFMKDCLWQNGRMRKARG